jgi:hypothetical protein
MIARSFRRAAEINLTLCAADIAISGPRSGASPEDPGTISILHEFRQSRKAGWQCCQANANQSPSFADQQVLCDEKVAPFAKSGVAFLFEPYSGVDVPIEVEVIVH